MIYVEAGGREGGREAVIEGEREGGRIPSRGSILLHLELERTGKSPRTTTRDGRSRA